MQKYKTSFCLFFFKKFKNYNASKCKLSEFEQSDHIAVNDYIQTLKQHTPTKQEEMALTLDSTELIDPKTKRMTNSDH